MLKASRDHESNTANLIDMQAFRLDPTLLVASADSDLKTAGAGRDPTGAKCLPRRSRLAASERSMSARLAPYV